MTESLTAVDLTNCDREPIHVPGAIQAHGVLLAFGASDLRLQMWSAHAAERLALHLDRGSRLGELFPSLDGQKVAVILDGPEGVIHPLELAPRDDPDGRIWPTAAHHYNGALLVELECESQAAFDSGICASFVSLPLRLNLVNQRLQACPTIEELYGAIASEVRSISGFDRVMVYRFLEDDHGAVVGESVDDRFDRFLGLHYPASDIPRQARRLYVLNAVRSIADVEAPTLPLEPSPIRSDNGQPLDLSFSSYRAVSPIHVEYLRNMGVRASMSISILCKGELWGLIACHHYSPRRLTFEQRAACEMLGQMAGSYLLARENDQQNRLRSARRDILSKALQTIAESPAFAVGVREAAEMLCKAADADGVALCWKDQPELVGSAPSLSATADLVKHRLGVGLETTATDRLAEATGIEADELQGVSGCMAAPLDASDLAGLLFFRNEYAREVHWAGNPNKPVEETESGVRLSPRLSFESWRESVVGRSRGWSEVDLEIGEAVRGGMVELLSRRAAALAKLNEELSRMNADLDSFAYAASHDLREPLRGLNSTAHLLLEELGEEASAQVAKRCEALQRLTRRMDELIEGLLRLSRAGRGDLERESISLAQVVSEAVELTFSGPCPSGVAVTSDNAATIDGDYLCIRELLTNLISNAVKYNNSAVKRIQIGVVDSEERGVEGAALQAVYVRDNGIGIEPDQHNQVFQIFRRLHAPPEYGGGIGAGLAVAKKIVQRHGGRIWLESDPGQGAAFFFTLSPAR